MGAQFLRFALVGLAATATTFAVLTCLVELFHLDAVLASVIGYAAGMVLNYLLNYHFTFRSTARHQVAAPRFLAVMMLGLGLNALLMHAFVHRIGLHYLPAQLGTIAVVLVWNYMANRVWSFRGQ